MGSIKSEDLLFYGFLIGGGLLIGLIIYHFMRNPVASSAYGPAVTALGPIDVSGGIGVPAPVNSFLPEQQNATNGAQAGDTVLILRQFKNSEEVSVHRDPVTQRVSGWSIDRNVQEVAQ